MKKVFLIYLVIGLIISFAACAGQAAEATRVQTVQTTEQAEQKPTEELKPTPTPTPIPTPTPTPESTMLMSFFGEEYNPFYEIEWPQNYTFAEYFITRGGKGEDIPYDDPVSYGLCLSADDSVQHVVEYMSHLIGVTQNINDNVKNLDDGQRVTLQGYLDAIGAEVYITINNYESLTVQISVVINKLEGYDIEDYIENIDLNFDENIIPDWGGQKNLFEELEPFYSILVYSTSPLDPAPGYCILCSRHYDLNSRDAGAYMYTLADIYGEMVAESCGNVTKEVEFELEGGALSLSHITQQDDFSFMFLAKNADKNICDYNWILK